MRPIETLLVLANLLAFLVLAIPPLHSIFWTRYLAPIGLLIAVAQVLVEGARWQMVPAYALVLVFFLVWLLGISIPGGIPVNRLIASIGIGLSVLGILVSIILPIVLPVFHFPNPTGPYAIGTTTYHWADTSRPEIFTTDPNDHRELMVQIWYPAKKLASQYAPYVQDVSAVMTATAQIHSWPDFTLQHIKYVTTQAAESVPVADDKPSYPVLIFLEGLTGFRQQNTFQVEELVSHGYIVVGIDQPGAAATVVFPDGHQIAIGELAAPPVAQMQLLINQSLSPAELAPLLNGQAMPNGIIPYFAQDVGFTLDELASINTSDPKGILTGKMDLEQTGVFGMSLGAMVGAETCLNDPRIKACLLEDAAMPADVVSKGLHQPTMFITRPAATIRLERQTAGGWPEAAIVQTLTTMRAVYTSAQGDGYYVQVPGMYHIDMTDLDLLSPILPLIGISGPIGAERAHDIVNVYSVAFFDNYLNNQPSLLLNGPSTQYPDVLFEKR